MKKRINLIFYKLKPKVDDKSEFKKSVQILNEAIKNLKNIKTYSIDTLNGPLGLSPTFETRGSLTFGTLIKTQINDIPPVHNPSNHDTKELPIPSGSGLGFSTSFVYDSETQIIMVESVQNGASVKQLLTFLNRNINDFGIESYLVIKPEQFDHFLNMTLIKKVKVKVARMEHGTLFNNTKKALSQLTQLADDTNLDSVEVTFTKTQRKASLNLSKFKTMVQSLLSFKETGEAEEIIVTGTYDDFGNLRTIDLIEEKLTDYFDIEKTRLQGAFALKRRYDKLETVYLGHQKSLKKVY
ncbi:MAG: hypothetical protein K9J84_09920 [Bacteroidia bacterium]|nr:hypothetical protein [Bacteroidia bacterium]